MQDCLKSRDMFRLDACQMYSVKCMPEIPLIAWGQHGAHLGPTGPRWAACWPLELCYPGQSVWLFSLCNRSIANWILVALCHRRQIRISFHSTTIISDETSKTFIVNRLWSRVVSDINRCHHVAFLDSMSSLRCHACVMASQWQTMIIKARPPQTRTWTRTFKWIHFRSLKAWEG